MAIFEMIIEIEKKNIYVFTQMPALVIITEIENGLMNFDKHPYWKW